MRTPPNLRGKYYPGWTTGGCADYEWCQVTSMCRTYSHQNPKCVACHSQDRIVNVLGDEDIDLKLKKQLGAVTDKQRLAIHQLELLTHHTVNSVEYERMVGPREQPLST